MWYNGLGVFFMYRKRQAVAKGNLFKITLCSQICRHKYFRGNRNEINEQRLLEGKTISTTDPDSGLFASTSESVCLR